MSDKDAYTMCKRCGRKLKNPKNKKIGMGVTCYRKWLNQNNHKRLWEVENG